MSSHIHDENKLDFFNHKFSCIRSALPMVFVDATLESVFYCTVCCLFICFSLTCFALQPLDASPLFLTNIIPFRMVPLNAAFLTLYVAGPDTTCQFQ